MIQISYAIDNYDTRARELKALKKAMKELNINKSYIFTYNQEDKIEEGGFEIEVVPVWKYLLK